MTFKTGLLNLLFDHLTGAPGHKNNLTGKDVEIIDANSLTAPLLNRVRLTTSRASGVRTVGDILTVTAPPGVELSNIQGLIDKGAGYVAIAGFVNTTSYTITASEVPPPGSLWPIVLMSVPGTMFSDPFN